MASQFCSQTLKELSEVVYVHETAMLTLCVSHLLFSAMATLGNLLAIRALWKATSLPANMRKLFLSLAVSDVFMGSFAQLMFGVIIALMLENVVNDNGNLDILCPVIINVCYFSLFLLACASFLTVTAIAVDRLVAISLHLRYQELVTSKSVIIAVAILWITSGVAASVFVSLPARSKLVNVIIELVGLLCTTVAYLRIYKVVRYHRNQIQTQLQLQNEPGRLLLREKKSALNALIFYGVFITCYLPYLCSSISSLTTSHGVSRVLANHITVFFVLLTSSLNPLVYCWRYREIREIVKRSVSRIFHIM